MSRIAELIGELCPNGVVHLSMGATGTFMRGSGIQKKDFLEQGFPAIHYGQIFTRYGLWASETYIFIDKAVAGKSKLAQPGDVVIATTSENDEDLAKAVAWLGNSPVAVSSDAMIYSPENLDSKFVSYFLNSTDFQKQKEKFITGTKVRRISSQNFSKIKIPVPPLKVQEEIVRILDRFTLLEAELEARRKQYAFYRDSLLNFENRGQIRCISLGDIADIRTGRKPVKVFSHSTPFPYVNAGTSESGYIESSNCLGDTVTTPSRGQGGIGYVGYQKDPFWLGPLCYRIRSNDKDLLNKYIYYYLCANPNEILKFKKEGGTPAINRADIASIKIAVPSPVEQERIISVLDRFDALVNDMSSGLPAEIAARRKQYEYYRDQLLTFKELQSEAA